MSIALGLIKNQQQAWLASTSGQYLQEQEQVLYDQAVVDLFGFVDTGNSIQMFFFYVITWLSLVLLVSTVKEYINNRRRYLLVCEKNGIVPEGGLDV